MTFLSGAVTSSFAFTGRDKQGAQGIPVGSDGLQSIDNVLRRGWILPIQGPRLDQNAAILNELPSGGVSSGKMPC
jgi:hypothetical protein